MSSQLFVTWFDVAGHQHLKKEFLAPWLLPWIYPWDLPCISYSLLVPWVLPCWHPWVLPCHLDTLGVQCTLNILVPLIYQQFRSDFIIAALTRPWWANSVLMTEYEYEYEYYSGFQKWPNTNTNIIRLPKNDQIRIRILFGFPKMTEYEYRY